MEKLSVKKPYTVLVMVILIIALGVVSLTRLQMDLLPSMSLPYLMIITTYPGASPERVEAEVSEPLENALGTISGVKNISSTSHDNYSLVSLEFEEETNMDGALVKVSSALDQINAALPEACGTPSVLELSMDMMATAYTAVNVEGYDIYELSDYVTNKVIPYLQRQNGVASVSSIGTVQKNIQVELNPIKISAINDKILEETDAALAEAGKQLEDAKKQVEDGQKMLEETESSFGSTISGMLGSQLNPALAAMATQMQNGINALIPQIQQLADNIAYNSNINDTISGNRQDMDNRVQQLNDLNARLAEAENAYREASATVNALNTDIAALKEEIETAAAAGEDTSALEEQLAAKQQELLQATGVLDAMQNAVDAARSAYTAASESLANGSDLSDALSSAASAAAGTYITEEQLAQLQQLTRTLQENQNVDGSSLSALMGNVSTLAGVLGQLSAILSSLEAADVQGQLSASISGIRGTMDQLSGGIGQLPNMAVMLEDGIGALMQGQLDAAVGFSTATNQLSDAQAQLSAATAQYEQAKEQAMKNANLDSLLSVSTLSSLIYAQNFSMPAGYIDDETDNAWLLKVGDEYDTTKEIAGALLIDTEAIGTVRLEDVADITVIDDSASHYARLNGEQGIVLSIFKASTSGTNAVSRTITKAFDELAEENPGMSYVHLMDQGNYITMIVNNVVTNILLGAFLAIIVLALFLGDFKPTLVVAVSIPMSVLLTLVLMYFTNMQLNIMTLSGLALGIGMLVDNSIVVMENIFRLRSGGMSAARAAVQGAKQVRGSIIASTLTTVCVFLPAVFTSGMVRDLLTPLALSIGYCLMSSLLMAMTVVPAACSTVMKKTQPKTHRFFDRLQDLYGRSLYWCLKHKFVPLGTAIVLLVVTVGILIRMGIVFLPEMTSNEIQVSIQTPEELTREEAYARTDEVMDNILTIDGIDNVGIMAQGSASLVSSMGGGSDNYGTFNCFVVVPEDTTPAEISQICKQIEKVNESTGCTVKAEAGGMSDMSSMMTGGADYSVTVYGTELDKLTEITAEVKDIIAANGGFTEITDGTEEGEDTLHLVIDKDKAMSYGLTTAQIYAEIASRINTTAKSTTVTIDGVSMEITIVDNTDPLTRENLLDIEFSSDSSMGGGSGMSSMMGGSSGMGAMMGGSSGMSSMMGGGSDMSSMMGGSDMSSMMSAFGGGDAEALTAEPVADASAADESDKNDEKDSDGKEADDKDEKDKDEDEDDGTHYLRDFARIEETLSLSSISRENQSRYLTVSAKTMENENATLLSRQLDPKLQAYNETLPGGYSLEITGSTSQINDMMFQMVEMALLGLLFIYMIMVAQFQSMLSPFIVLFTIPLAFTGGMLALLAKGEQLSMLSMIGFVVLMGTVVNNGIVFVDYANQLRIGGLERHDALVATGQTRMRPILMTALTTILSLIQMIVGTGMASQMGGGMALVIAGGLMYATLMTLYIVPVIYDIFFRRKPLIIDVGDDINDAPDDAAEYLAKLKAKQAAAEEKEAKADTP